jgi:hypothetical protein
MANGSYASQLNDAVADGYSDFRDLHSDRVFNNPASKEVCDEIESCR